MCIKQMWRICAHAQFCFSLCNFLLSHKTCRTCTSDYIHTRAPLGSTRLPCDQRDCETKWGSPATCAGHRGRRSLSKIASSHPKTSDCKLRKKCILYNMLTYINNYQYIYIYKNILLATNLEPIKPIPLASWEAYWRQAVTIENTASCCTCMLWKDMPLWTLSGSKRKSL